MGLSLRETAAVLEIFGVHRSHQAVWQWVHQFADSVPNPPSATRVAVDETAIHVGTEWYWLYTAISLDWSTSGSSSLTTRTEGEHIIQTRSTRAFGAR
jgi:transposase-like protein